MYQLAKGGVIKDGRLYIPNAPGNRHWDAYQKWLGEGNTPLPADLEPAPEAPLPTVSELIDAIDGRDKGDSAKWDAIKLRKITK